MNILKIKERRKKKGAIELSLNLIIMLIIGLVILGLVISFVRNMMNKATSSFNTQLTAQDQQNLHRVLQSSKPFDIYPSPSITVKSNNPKKIYLKIRNLKSDSPISIGAGPLSNTVSDYDTITKNDGTTPTGTIVISGPGFSLKPGQVDAKMYFLTAKLPPGTYFVTINVNNLLGTTNMYNDFSFTLIVQ